MMINIISQFMTLLVHIKNSMMKKAVRSLTHSPTGMLGFVLLVLVLIIAVLSPFIIRFDPNEVHIVDKMLPPFWSSGGKESYLLGTDYLGRDIFSRIIDGAHISIIVGLVSVAFAGCIGMVVGLVSGFFGGWIDALIMRIVDSIRTIPTILLNVVIAMVMGPGIRTVIIAIGNSPNPLIKKTTPDLPTERWGGIQTDENGRTGKKNVYAGGDAVTGAATVILAMGAGKKAAAAILEDHPC